MAGYCMAAIQKITQNKLHLRILSASEIRSLHCVFLIFQLYVPLIVSDETKEKGTSRDHI